MTCWGIMVQSLASRRLHLANLLAHGMQVRCPAAQHNICKLAAPAASAGSTAQVLQAAQHNVCKPHSTSCVGVAHPLLLLNVCRRLAKVPQHLGRGKADRVCHTSARPGLRAEGCAAGHWQGIRTDNHQPMPVAEAGRPIRLPVRQYLHGNEARRASPAHLEKVGGGVKSDGCGLVRPPRSIHPVCPVEHCQRKALAVRLVLLAPAQLRHAEERKMQAEQTRQLPLLDRGGSSSVPGPAWPSPRPPSCSDTRGKRACPPAQPWPCLRLAEQRLHPT